MGDGLSDFMDGVFRVVGSVLNALFAGETRRSTSFNMWTSDDVSEMAMAAQAPVSDAPMTIPQPSMQQRAQDAIATLQQIDPDFNELQFVDQATRGYQTYLAADAAMDPDALAAIATPNFVDQYRQRVAQWRAAGVSRVGHDVKILGASVMKVSVDGTQQSIVVRFSASGVRFTQDADTGAATEGSTQSDTFTEFGTFVRPAGTTTPKSAGEGGATHCPSCGAPTTAGAAKCPFCGTQLTGTGAIWLLDHISVSAYT